MVRELCSVQELYDYIREDKIDELFLLYYTDILYIARLFYKKYRLYKKYEFQELINAYYCLFYKSCRYFLKKRADNFNSYINNSLNACCYELNRSGIIKLPQNYYRLTNENMKYVDAVKQGVSAFSSFESDDGTNFLIESIQDNDDVVRTVIKNDVFLRFDTFLSSLPKIVRKTHVEQYTYIMKQYFLFGKTQKAISLELNCSNERVRQVIEMLTPKWVAWYNKKLI